MSTYTVTVATWDHGWELHIDGVGVTQTTSVSDAERAAREYLSLALGVEDETSFDIDLGRPAQP